MYNILKLMKQGKQTKKEDGFAAILVAMIMLVILSLLTVGFAELMRSEQESATNKHLSSQAFYAAEAGINDATRAINAGYDKIKRECKPLESDDPAVDGDEFLQKDTIGDSASYSCLLIDPQPPTLEYGAVDTDESKVVFLTGAKVTGDVVEERVIGSMYIGWQDPDGTENPDGSTTFRTTGGFPQAKDWKSPAVLRMSLVPMSASMLSRQNLIENNFAAFLYPNGSSGGVANVSYLSGRGSEGGVLANGNCATAKSPRPCGVTIRDLGESSYMLTMRSIYKKSRVTIKIFDQETGEQLRIKNAQVLVDSTGKAQDVLRRVQARVPVRSTYPHTDYGIETAGNLCKQLQLRPASSTNNCTP
jgi:hypothetical protein